MAANVDTVRDTAADALDQLQRSATPLIKQGKRQAGALLDQSGELLDSVSSQATDVAGDVAKSLVSYTKKNPLTAMLLAVGVGAVLMGVTRAMKSDR